MSLNITVSTSIPISINQAWELITDSTKFHALYIPGVWEKYDRNNAKRGTIIRGCVLSTGEWDDRYIVDFEKPYKFSFGYSINDWSFMYELAIIESQITELKFTRGFRELSWYDGLFKKNKRMIEYENLAYTTIRRINAAATNISNGHQDDVFQTSR